MRPPHRCLLLLGLAAALAAPADAEVTWFPREGIFPRRVADPHEPLLRLTLTGEENRTEAMLGAPIPLVRSGDAGLAWAVNLEASALLVLGRDGGFFPLRTADGAFGLDLEAGDSRWMGRLRLTHISAHAADGDTAVTYRGKTVSREFLDVEAGLRSGGFFLYGGGGAAWHAVPEEPGPRFFAGGVWSEPRRPWGPVAAVHASLDRRRDWRVTASVFGGVGFGTGPVFRMGLRYFDGNRPEGQYDEDTIRYLGAEIQYSP